MKEFYTESDAGSVKVGILGQFITLIANGYGDGETAVTILEPGEKLPDGAHFETVVEGSQINIYAYDCNGYTGDQVVTTISGRYGCYSLDLGNGGAVIFQKWE